MRAASLGPTPLAALNGLEMREPAALFLAGKAVELDRVLAHVRLDGEHCGFADG
jgi:hypothetical protein